MKRILLSFATLMILAGSASATDRREFNKMKYGREYLTAGEEQQAQVQKKAADRKHARAATRTCCQGCC